MSEETKKQPETEQEQAAAETKAPAAESDKQETEPAAEKTMYRASCGAYLCR